MRQVSSPYRVTAPDAASPLRQCEIVSNIERFRLDLPSVGTEAPAGKYRKHAYALVISQDCDLEQDFRTRNEGKASDKLMPSVLFCEAMTAEELFGIIRQTNRKLWDRIKINKDERYHFMQKIEPACDCLNQGLPELAIDFKRYFSLPTDEVYRRIEIGEAIRRCVMVSPYLEHLSTRFASYLSRVALPEDHLSQAEPA